MKKAALLPALLLANSATSLAFDNEPADFRGIPWGAPIAAYEGQLSVVEEGGETILYRRQEDKLSIGAADLKGVYYAFNAGRFTSAMTQTEGLPNNAALLDALTAQFGRPLRPNRFMDRYYWKGKVATISMVCTISLKGECMTVFSSSQSMAQDSAERAEKAKNAGEDL